jgi:hypothetical protein
MPYAVCASVHAQTSAMIGVFKQLQSEQLYAETSVGKRAAIPQRESGRMASGANCK